MYTDQHGKKLSALVGEFFPEKEREEALRHLSAKDFAYAEICIVTTVERLMNSGQLPSNVGQDILKTVSLPQQEISRIRARSVRFC